MEFQSSSQNGGKIYATLGHALQDKPGLRRCSEQARTHFGDKRRPMYDHGEKVTLACTNLGVIDLGEAERNPNGDHRVAFEDALHHQPRDERLPPYLSERGKHGLRFFDVLRTNDETMNWKGYEPALEIYKDVLITMYVRMVDILLSATDPDLAKELAALPISPKYPSPNDLPKRKMATAKAALVFYAPFASYLSTDLYRDLMDTSMSVLHPRAYQVVEAEIKRQGPEIAATEAFLNQFFEGDLLPIVRSTLEHLVKIVGWKVRRKSIGSTLAKLLYKKGIPEGEITESTIVTLLYTYINDLLAGKGVFEDRDPRLIGVGAVQGLCENMMMPHAMLVTRRENLFVPTGLGQRQLIMKFRPRRTTLVPFEWHFRTVEMERNYHFGRGAHILHKQDTVAGVLTAEPAISEDMVKRTRDYLARLGKIDSHAPTALSAAAALAHSTMKIVTTIRDGKGYTERTFYFPPGATVADLIAASVNPQKNGAIVQIQTGDVRTTGGSRLVYGQPLDPTLAYVATLTTPGFNRRTLLELRDSSNTVDAKNKYGDALERVG